MAYVVKDRVKVTSTSTGTGTFTLGEAVEGFQSFAAISPDAWNISTTVYSGSSFSVSSQETTPRAIYVKPDGAKMYIVGTDNDTVYEYNMSNPWDITTASYVQGFSISAQETAPEGLFFKPDGTKMYVAGSTGDDVNEYNLSSAWDVSTASYVQNFSVATQDLTPRGIFFKSDGTKMYVIGGSGTDVNEYSLSGAWDVSTATYVQNFSVSAQATNPAGIQFKPDGTKMYISSEPSIYEYSLSSAWDISTATYSGNVGSVASGSRAQFAFKSDGSQFFFVTADADAVLSYYLSVQSTYYCITNGTDWEIGLGTSYAGGALARTQVFESSNANAAVNWGAGTKDVFVTFPAENTQGTVPTGDDSSVGTDLVAWKNLKKYLDAGVVNGVPYSNNSMNGVVSTYSLVYTSSAASWGGVLSPNGDIHFVPYSANRGQKISASGVVSTYSLAYTVATAYVGGVLAPNGDIHFVPNSAAVGQKVSASGVVSTYSLVYTVSGAYRGGVLAPNGDIHFVPLNAPRGQKVSSAGVVSTYSLVYTSGSKYIGGVLAQNGDIHFVPNGAAVGQKISAAGVVSTYSLVYTTTDAYSGGVLASNGDIHFIPRDAAVGQKISSAGVVSTYSLAYTVLNAYNGGVLAPNGDIHFVPYAAAVGQKISSSGVVSTYSLIFTSASAYSGGILSPGGEVFFIAEGASRGQKISTGVSVNPGYALSPFFNKL